MKFRKSLLTLGLASAMAAPAAFAGAPVAFGGYTNSGGAITSNLCAAGSGFTCSSQPISDTNFLQVQVTRDSDGATFFQTIIDEPDAAMGDFTSESFTTTGSSNGGVAARQTIADLASTTGMASVDTILTGSFRDAGEKKTDIIQNVWNSGGTYAASDFQADFGVAMGMSGGQMIMDVSIDQRLGDAAGGTNTGFSDTFGFDSQMNETTGAMVGKRIDIDTGVALNGDPATNTNDQTFAFSSRMGNFTDMSGNSWGVTVDNSVTGLKDMGSAVTVDWVAADAVAGTPADSVAQVLIGQTVTGAGQFAFARMNDLTDVDGTGPDGTEGGEISSLTTSDATTLFSFSDTTSTGFDPF